MATGYDVKQHEGWCIPLSLSRQKGKIPEEEFLNEVLNQARLIKLRDDGIVKRNYVGDGWWIVAPPPDARPVYGSVIKAQPADRSKIMAVPTNTPTTSGDPLQRLAQQKKKRQADKEGINFPAEDEVWIGTTRIKADGTIEIYPLDNPKPLLIMDRHEVNIKSGSSKFDHDPEQMSFQSHSVTPNAKDIPSTNTIPVQTFIATNPEFSMITSLAIAIAKYVAKSSKERDETSVDVSSTEYQIQYIDYEDLRRDPG